MRARALAKGACIIVVGSFALLMPAKYATTRSCQRIEAYESVVV